jgi:hypothetical protein
MHFSLTITSDWVVAAVMPMQKFDKIVEVLYLPLACTLSCPCGPKESNQQGLATSGTMSSYHNLSNNLENTSSNFKFNDEELHCVERTLYISSRMGHLLADLGIYFSESFHKSFQLIKDEWSN